MKISYYSYPWAMDVPGGGERQLLAYREHLGRNGVDVKLFDLWSPGFSETDIFHCFSVMPGALELCDYAKRRGAKLVVSPNLWVTPETKGAYPVQTIWNYFELADAIVVNSHMEARALSSVFGFPEHKFHVVYNAAESDFMIWEGGEAFREKVGIQGSYVLNVANVEPRKNQLRFMEALRKERPDLTLVVVGNVRDSAYARACENAGEGRWKAVGSLPYASRLMRSAMGGCEFFAMPSLLETPSIAAIEAAAAGARIVLTGEGSTREYFGDTVIYVDPGSDDSMRRGIRLAPETDPERSMWLARDRYLWPKVMPAMLAVYASLLPNRVSAQ